MNNGTHHYFAVLVLVAVIVLPNSLAMAQAAESKNTEGVLPIISGKVIKESDLLVYLGPQLKQLKSQEYELKLHTLNNPINQRLLESEAKDTVSRRKRFFNRR